MTERPSGPDPYLAQHLKEALSRDPRVSGLGVGVSITTDAVVLTGTLGSSAQQAAAIAVVRELLPTYSVRDETILADLTEPTEPEPVP